MERPGRLGTDRFGDLGDVVAEAGGQNAAEEVQVPVAFDVKDVATLAVVERDGRVVVERQPVGQDCPVPLSSGTMP